MQSHLDDPSNGMMLDFYAHTLFDNFKWCLNKTDVRVPSIVIISLTTHPDRRCIHSETLNARLLRMPKNDLVTFRDHSNDFNSESSDSHRKRKRPVALPNPLYISIHATLAGVLNMSGAGRFFDELLDKYKDDEGNVFPVRSWPELEKVMEEKVLKESIAESFRSVKVY